MELEELTKTLLEMNEITILNETGFKEKLSELKEKKPEHYQTLNIVVEEFTEKIKLTEKELKKGTINGQLHGYNFFPAPRKEKGGNGIIRKFAKGIIYIVDTPVRLCDKAGDAYRNWEDQTAYRKGFYGEKRKLRQKIDYSTAFFASALLVSEFGGLCAYLSGHGTQSFAWALFGVPALFGIQVARELYEERQEKEKKQNVREKLKSDPSYKRAREIDSYKTAIDFKLKIQKLTV